MSSYLIDDSFSVVTQYCFHAHDCTMSYMLDIFGTFVPELFLERKTMCEVPCMENTSTEELQNTFGPDLVSDPKLVPNVSFEESQGYHEFFGHKLMTGSELNSPQKDTSNMGPTGGEASESDEEESLCEVCCVCLVV